MSTGKPEEEIAEKAASTAGTTSAAMASQNGASGVPGLDGMGKVQAAASYAGASGELKYQVDFAIPSFRDLEPKIGLVYNSHATSKSGAMSLVGTGWSLKGFSAIERASARRGVPTYESGKDIFLLDGMEMLKCNSSAVTVGGQSITYADSHVKTNPSPGCAAGGDFTTLSETYFRIEYDQTANEFTVTQKKRGEIHLSVD